jgi:hypothetical protein
MAVYSTERCAAGETGWGQPRIGPTLQYAVYPFVRSDIVLPRPTIQSQFKTQFESI